ncbi:MAG TPA: carboxylating nicotinate-nucleotide diphosphorylase [Polyangiaceae bacterium]|nr:carboxylating nicotinate-nucleotide diphosphorylase [Polyangiaceae bacterium]
MAPPSSYDDSIRRALLEDFGSGDVTSDALIPADAWACAEAVAKSPLVVSGVSVFSRVFHLVNPAARVEALVHDGDQVEPGAVLLRVEGPTRDLLGGEHTALNFLQQLSGVATLTRRYVERLQGPTRIADTRKTVPGLRLMQRAAVRHGGGHNHRDCLGSAVLIKDNHIAAAGSVTLALERARAHAPHTSRLEIEVADTAQLDEALAAGADIVMLDNFTDEQLPAAVERARGRALVEVSGGITLERIPFLSSLGVDVISVGALTHSPPAADISLRLWPVERDAPPLPTRA